MQRSIYGHDIYAKDVPTKYLYYTRKKSTKPPLIYYLHQFVPGKGHDVNSGINQYPVYSLNVVPVSNQVRYIFPRTMDDYQQPFSKLEKTHPYFIQPIPIQPNLSLQGKNTQLNFKIKPVSSGSRVAGNRTDELSNERKTPELSAKLKPLAPLLVSSVRPPRPLRSALLPLRTHSVTSPTVSSTKSKPSSTLRSIQSLELTSSDGEMVILEYNFTPKFT